MNDFFTFTKGERVAIIVLAAVIFLIIAANFFVAKRPSNVNFYLHNLDSIWALHDKSKDESLKTKECLSRQVTKSPSRQVTKSPSHQVKTKSLNVSKSELNSQKPKAKSQKLKANSPKLIVNLNSTDTTELKSLPGIGSFFARNIVEYREELGGYVEINQLLEVYAFDSSRLETITPYINIDSISLRKINVNADDFKIILRHPYIEYEDVKKIVNHREKRGFIKNWEEYLKVVGRNDVDERLRWYLRY
ncbi:MAG: helix-hairpin-helix domain-containing protein [Bacteroidales bacterium]|nr:helix-hairpin-helix domain-containing protein [Bacteroidales bacterium]